MCVCVCVSEREGVYIGKSVWAKEQEERSICSNVCNICSNICNICRVTQVHRMVTKNHRSLPPDATLEMLLLMVFSTLSVLRKMHPAEVTQLYIVSVCVCKSFLRKRERERERERARKGKLDTCEVDSPVMRNLMSA